MPSLNYSSGGVDIAAKTIYLTGSVEVTQERGVSEKDVMSQKSVTRELEKIDTKLNDLTLEKLNKSEAEQKYLTKTDADEKYQPAGDYALKADIPDIDHSVYATKDELPRKVSELENDVPYLTEANLTNEYYTADQVDERLENLKANNESWLHDYYNKDEVDRLLEQSGEATEVSHKEIDERIKNLEAIDHDSFATKEELEENYVQKPVLENYDTKEEVNQKIEDAIAGENIGSLLTKSEAEEKYQPKGDYLVEHQSLEEYAKKVDVSEEIDEKVSEEIEKLNIAQYETIAGAEEKYQPKGDYLVEHQDISHLMPISRAEEEHAVIDENLTELKDRLEIAEKLAANYETFTNWQKGYYAPEDEGLTNKLDHDGCYYQICNVSACRKDNFFAHYPFTDKNIYIFEYSGEPGPATFIKKTPKTGFDLVFDLDFNTRYIVCFAYTPQVGNYYVRGIKANSEEANSHVEMSYLQDNYYNKEEIDEKLKDIDVEIPEIPEIDLSDYYTKSEIDTKISEIEIPEEYDDSVIKGEISDIKKNINSIFVAEDFSEYAVGKGPFTVSDGNIKQGNAGSGFAIPVPEGATYFKFTEFTKSQVSNNFLIFVNSQNPENHTEDTIISYIENTFDKGEWFDIPEGTNYIIGGTIRSSIYRDKFAGEFMKIPKQSSGFEGDGTYLTEAEADEKYQTKLNAADIQFGNNARHQELEGMIKSIENQLSGVDELLNEILGV